MSASSSPLAWMSRSNLVVVTAADAVVAVGGRHGTLSEIGLALRQGREVVTLSSWRVDSEHLMGGPRFIAREIRGKQQR